MNGDPRHDRRSIRLRGHDYTQAGAYFITICTRDRQCLFGEVVDGAMRLNDAGRIAHEEWFRAAVFRPYVQLHTDEFGVMPNHIHGIIRIVDGGRATDDGASWRHAPPTDDGTRRRRAPSTDHGDAPDTAERFGQPVSGSVPTVVRAFKSATTRRVNAMRATPGAPVWQRNYYERIVRDDESLYRIRQYILDNPKRWAFDPMNAVGRAAPRPFPWQD